MSRSRPLLTLATLALLCAAPPLLAQGDGNSPDWNLPAQTSAGGGQPRAAVIYNTAPAPAASADSAPAMARTEPLRGRRAMQPMQLPPVAAVPEERLVTGMPLELQLGLMRDQLRELQRRLALNEQLLAQHRHSFQTTGFATQKYRTLRHFIDNSPDAEYLIPSGPRERETSPPLLPAQP